LAIGRVIRAIAGFIYVEHGDGTENPVECSSRGKLKLSDQSILVGDRVEFFLEDQKGVISRILPRENALKRPYIANVNLLVLVFAHQNPDPNDYLIAKFLVLAEKSKIPYLLVFNKTDLVAEGQAKRLTDFYRDHGYQVLCSSVVTRLGKRKLQRAISGKVAVFTGPSGVGKSALLNMIVPGFQLRTGPVSAKIGRGKHTTREAQLLRIAKNSYVADTPGFSQIDLDFLEPSELAALFPEFHNYRGECKFSSCLHQAEPDCAVKKAVREGKIRTERYRSYLQLLEEIKAAWEKRYK